MIKLKMPQMPKVKMPDVKGKVGKLTKAVGDKTKGAVKSIQRFEPSLKINETIRYILEDTITITMGMDPELMVYRHKIGDIYGKKNLKAHAKYSTSKSEESFLKAVNSIMKIREPIVSRCCRCRNIATIGIAYCNRSR